MKSSLEKMWRDINNFFSLHSFIKPFIWTVTHYWTGTNDLYRCYMLFEMVILLWFNFIFFFLFEAEVYCSLVMGPQSPAFIGPRILTKPWRSGPAVGPVSTNEDAPFWKLTNRRGAQREVSSSCPLWFNGFEWTKGSILKWPLYEH